MLLLPPKRLTSVLFACQLFGNGGEAVLRHIVHNCEVVLLVQQKLRAGLDVGLAGCILVLPASDGRQIPTVKGEIGDMTYGGYPFTSSNTYPW